MVEVIEIKLDPFITLDLNDSDNAEDQKSNGDFDFDIQDGYCSSGEIIVTEGFDDITDEKAEDIEFGIRTWYQCPTCQVLLDHRFTFLEHTGKHMMEVRDPSEQPALSHPSCMRGLEDEIDSAAIQILSPILFLPKMDSSHPASLYSFPTSNTHNPGFPCTMCNKRVSTKDNLRRHMMRHTGEKPYACHLCNYRSIQKNHLQGHIFHNHGRTELETMRTIEIPTPGKKLGGRGAERVRNVKFPFGPYRCELCNVGFKKNDNLQRHNQKRHKDLLGSGNSVAFEVQPILTLPFPPEAKHNQAKTKAGQGRGKKRKESPSVAPHPLAYHPCPVCSKLFRSQERLRLHLLTHGGTGIRPYPCSECGKVYRQKYHLKRHVINTHYSSSATKLLSPSSTYKPTSSYLMSAGRNHHRGSSAPVSCLICARVLCNVDSLRRHILIHQGIKPFACECCGETFRQKHHVTSHMRRHTTTHSNSSMDPGVEEEGQGDKQQTKHQGCVQVGTGLGGSGNSGFMNSMVGY